MSHSDVSISIVTACLNAEATIKDCLQSVSQQTLQVEHVIVDGLSRDNTVAIIQENLARHSLFIREPDRGVYDAINKGIQASSGEIVGILNADDMYEDDRVLERVAQVFADTEVNACYGDLVYVDRVDPRIIRRYWRSGPFSENRFYWGWMPPHPTFFVRRAAYERFGLFRDDLGTAADYELMLRLLLTHNLGAVYLPEILVRMRMGGLSNTSLWSRIKANRMDKMAWKVNDLQPLPWTFLLKPVRKLGQYLFRP